MKKLSLLIIALGLLTVARPNVESRTALVDELTELLGVSEVVHDAKKATNQQADEAVEQMFAQINAGLPGLSKETWAALRSAADKMMQKVQGSWTAEEAIQIWQADYTADFTDAELSEIIAAAKTPLGRKQVQAGKRANGALQKFLMERAKGALDGAMKEYVAELQRIVTQAVPKLPPPEAPR